MFAGKVAEYPGHGHSQRYAAPKRHSKNKAKSIAIQINGDITRSRNHQDILRIVRKDLDENELNSFDGVAISTAIHRLASLDLTSPEAEAVVSSREFLGLVNVIPRNISSLAIRNVSNILWGFAKMQFHPSGELMACLCDLLQRNIQKAVAQNISNATWALAAMNHRPSERLLDMIEVETQKKYHEFSGQNLSNLILSFAKLNYVPKQPRTMECIRSRAFELLDSFNTQALSNIVWGLSKMHLQDEDLYGALVRSAAKRSQEFNPQNIALTMWGLANIKFHPGEEFLERFCEISCQKIHGFTAQNISNTLWALAKMDRYHQVFEQAAQRAAEIWPEFNGQSTGNMVWAFAHLDHPMPPNLLKAMASRVPCDYEEWTAQNLANLAWGMTVLKDEEVNRDNDVIFFSVSKEIESRLVAPSKLVEFTTQNLSNYFWSLGSRRVKKSRSSLDALMGIYSTMLHQFKPQELANITWACARLQYYNVEVLDRIGDLVSSKMDSFEGQNLSNILWAFGKLRHLHKRLMYTASLAVPSKLLSFSYQHLSNILWSYATLNFEASSMFSCFKLEILEQMKKDPILDEQLANIIWALAIANEMDPRTWDIMIKEIDASISKSTSTKDETLAQTFQAQMLMKARQPESHSWMMPQHLAMAAKSAWEKATKNVSISDFHKSVSSVLQSLGQDHEIEHLTSDACFSIDIAIPSEHIALEVDGPQHFTRSKEPLGDTLARNDLLKARGWKVITIPYFAWSQDKSMQRTLVSQMLSNVRDEPR